MHAVTHLTVAKSRGVVKQNINMYRKMHRDRLDFKLEVATLESNHKASCMCSQSSSIIKLLWLQPLYHYYNILLLDRSVMNKFWWHKKVFITLMLHNELRLNKHSTCTYAMHGIRSMQLSVLGGLHREEESNRLLSCVDGHNNDHHGNKDTQHCGLPEPRLVAQW